MIDSPPAHPDTIITTLVNLEKALNSFGMHPHHSRLYQTACLVHWNDPLRWTNVILHPGVMHTLTSFLGCVGTLMKASGVDVLISAAFAGITSIVNGKAWTNALRAYRLIMAVVRHNFYSNGAKTYEELNVYLETARGHPTGRLWVDCFVTPTLLSFMFQRGERNGDFLLQQHCLKAMLPYFFAAGHHNYDRWSTFPSVPRRTYWQVRMSVGTRMGDRSATRSVQRADIYQAREGLWRYEGHFNEPRASGCVGE